MRWSRAHCALVQHFRLLCGMAVVGIVAAGSPCFAQGGLTVVRVEEDWELVIDTPDPNSDGPQLNCVLSAPAADDTLYAVFEINHRTLPEFVKGGMQLQVWSNSFNLAAEPGPREAPLAAVGETIRWTQAMELADGQITFEILNGASTTWGDFGGQGYLKSSQLTDLANLNGYAPSDSVTNSGISYAANRVQSLVLKRVRYVASTGDTWEDSVPKTVHQKLD